MGIIIGVFKWGFKMGVINGHLNRDFKRGFEGVLYRYFAWGFKRGFCMGILNGILKGYFHGVLKWVFGGVWGF